MTLTNDQISSLGDVLEWLTSSQDQFMTLRGYAGTGKTTLLNTIVSEAIDLNKRVVVTATTNKAVKVLREKITFPNVELRTIHSLLNIKAKQVEDKEIFEPDRNGTGSVGRFHLVIVDECSMISSIDDHRTGSKSLLTILQTEIVNKPHVKVLFCGDAAQLPPIGEERSKSFDFPATQLNEIVRHDDSIAQVASKLRENKQLVSLSELLVPGSIEQLKRGTPLSMFEGFRDDPDKIRLLAWRNVTVAQWNERIRRIDWKERILPPWIVGDILVAQEPCMSSTEEADDVLLMNSAEGKVLQIMEDRSSFKLKVERFEDSRHVWLRVVRPEYAVQLQKELQTLAKSKQWKDFWELKKSYHNVQHAYALTVHKSQGSTFNNVVIDYGDISLNRNIFERNQLLYVAITRASEKIFIL